MSLMERLDDISKETQVHGCKLIRILHTDKIPDDAREKFLSLLAMPHSDPTRVPSSTLARLLRSEGFDVSDKALERHRNKDCPCYRHGGSQS